MPDIIADNALNRRVSQRLAKKYIRFFCFIELSLLNDIEQKQPELLVRSGCSAITTCIPACTSQTEA
ncbi:MAG: hypothetical protein LBL26_09955 [Peptococcaceae bacterium]|jgi:hypothetical protein|nr:hypothetical protein [Peptococcaceae bacterium]